MFNISTNLEKVCIQNTCRVHCYYISSNPYPPTRQRHALIMSPRRLTMTSYFIPLLGMYESLPDVFFRRRIAVHIENPKDVRKNVRKDYKYDVLYWSVKGRLKDGLLSDVIFITRTFLSKYQIILYINIIYMLF